tara:strand:+ start:7202 stop:7372 length:171 start_codon:yes stop_codon:yes gene_type:complete
MNIRNAQYLKDLDNKNIAIKVTIDETEVNVPLDLKNRHYAAILEWVADGNTIAEAE